MVLEDYATWYGGLLDHRCGSPRCRCNKDHSLTVEGVHAKAFTYPTPPGSPGTNPGTASNYQIATAGQVIKLLHQLHR